VSWIPNGVLSRLQWVARACLSRIWEIVDGVGKMASEGYIEHSKYRPKGHLCDVLGLALCRNDSDSFRTTSATSALIPSYYRRHWLWKTLATSALISNILPSALITKNFSHFSTDPYILLSALITNNFSHFSTNPNILPSAPITNFSLKITCDRQSFSCKEIRFNYLYSGPV
jgi:hypothetical protein